MDRLIYTALSGMQASMDQQRVTASNMANAQTIGFRAELMDQRAVTVQGDEPEVRAMQNGQVRGARLDQGETIETGRPLDLALQGEAFLAVQAEDGSEAYTRRGDLSVGPGGLLTNGDGALVLGEGGPLTVPLSGTVSVSPDGTITVADPQTPEAPPLAVGRIRLVNPAGSAIAKGLDGLFRVEGGGVLPTDEEATVKSGYLEQSNVKPTEVLVAMIEQQRLFAIRGKLISTARDIDEAGAQLMRLA